jgi:hypothetical protein
MLENGQKSFRRVNEAATGRVIRLPNLEQRGVAPLDTLTLMPPEEHDEKIRLIYRLCELSQQVHEETVRLVETLSNEPRYAASTRLLKPEPRAPKKR